MAQSGLDLILCFSGVCVYAYRRGRTPALFRCDEAHGHLSPYHRRCVCALDKQNKKKHFQAIILFWDKLYGFILFMDLKKCVTKMYLMWDISNPHVVPNPYEEIFSRTISMNVDLSFRDSRDKCTLKSILKVHHYFISPFIYPVIC